MLSALLLAACPEPSAPGFDPSNPRPLDPSLRRPPPPGSLRPDEPTPPPGVAHKDAPPTPPAAEPPKETPPPPDPDAPPSKDDLAAKFSVRAGIGTPHAITIEGDPKAATVREVKGSKDGEGSLKTGQLGAKDVAAFLAALDKLEWWKLPSADSGISVKRGSTSRTFSAACAKGKSCPNSAADALVKGLAAKAKAPPDTKVLKFKSPAAGKGAPTKAHCAEHERPNFVTCVADSGSTLDHCSGKGKKFVCFASPYETKGMAVVSDVAADEKKKPPAVVQPWAIELASDRCIATQGHWRCDHDTEVAKVSMGKTWLAWPGEGPPQPVKQGYAE
ncbi:MAG: hypothetical protein QM723_16310 [Myxococcaceae bacterium]